MTIFDRRGKEFNEELLKLKKNLYILEIMIDCHEDQMEEWAINTRHMKSSPTRDSRVKSKCDLDYRDLDLR